MSTKPSKPITLHRHPLSGHSHRTDYPNVRAWLGRIESLPGFVPMQKTHIGLAIA